MKKIYKKKLRDFIRELRKKNEVIAPVRDGERVFFKKLARDDEVHLESNPTKSPKEFFFPQSETLFEFRSKDGLELNPNLETMERVLFGIRPCDVHSLLLLDLIWGGEFEDPYYKERREKTIIIALSCTEPMDGCFCTSFGTGPSIDKGADLLLTDMGDYYLAEPFTARGEGIIKSKLFEGAGTGDKETKDERIRIAGRKIRKLDMDGIPEKLTLLFEDELWDNLSSGCVSCAICTFLCPTCYCFDVVDEGDIFTLDGKRLRCWDTCMVPSFTKMAGGENPRATRKDRLKQRVYHKLGYMWDRYGKFGCVGCGRCIRYCPVGVNIMEIISKVK
jgi:sulfhydrogenase subunit beta (sulfur reductase)